MTPRRRSGKCGRAVVQAIFLFIVLLPAYAQTDNPRDVSGPGFESLSLEELMSVEIVSASNLSEKLIQAPATAIVINRREIDLTTYPFPDQPTEGLRANNRITTEDLGTYVQSRWRISERHQLHFI